MSFSVSFVWEGAGARAALRHQPIPRARSRPQVCSKGMFSLGPAASSDLLATTVVDGLASFVLQPPLKWQLDLRPFCQTS